MYFQVYVLPQVLWSIHPNLNAFLQALSLWIKPSRKLLKDKLDFTELLSLFVNFILVNLRHVSTFNTETLLSNPQWLYRFPFSRTSYPSVFLQNLVNGNT